MKIEMMNNVIRFVYDDSRDIVFTSVKWLVVRTGNCHPLFDPLQ